MPSPPFLADDQKDKDFFDKLDDEFSIAGSGSEPAIIARAISNASIGERLEDSEDAEFATGEEDRQESGVVQELFEEEKTPEVGSSPPLPSANGVASCSSEQSQEAMMGTMGFRSTGSSMGKSNTSKGTSVKEVQWSAFNVNSPQFDSGAFGSGADFFTENADGPDNQKSSFMENSAADLSTYPEQQDARYCGLFNWQVAEANDPQYWEELYPGWKFDTSTREWYQIDGYDATTTAQSENCNVASENMQESYQDKVLEADNGNISDQGPEISYLQQTTQLVTRTVAGDCFKGDVSSWKQVSQESTQYPPNMVFDPQYPGWYYDTNTQQWQTLESYTKAIQKTAANLQGRGSQDLKSSDGFAAMKNSSLYNEVGQHEESTTQGLGSQEMGARWNGSGSSYVQQNMWQPAQVNKSVKGFSGNEQIDNFYGSTGNVVNHLDHQKGYKTLDSGHGYGNCNGAAEFQSFIPAEKTYQFNQPKVVQSLQEHLSDSYYGHQNSINHAQQPIWGTSATYSPCSYALKEGRPSAGHPPHALVTFGFGGKLVVMKDASSLGSKLDYGSQDIVGGTISILSLGEVVMDKADASNTMTGCCHYFHSLCQQSLPGPLVGGNAAAKDVNKWIDEKLAQCKSPMMDVREGELLRLLLSLLKILYQHYGKLRSPFGADLSVEDPEGPQAAVSKLFASASKNGTRPGQNGTFTTCMQNVPSEAWVRTTAVEVQNLLVSGKRKEALRCAQAGKLWGPALVLAAQLGGKFYVDTVKQMAHCQFVSGSPLRTLCLLIAGQPADVFSVDSSTNISFPGADSAAQQSTKVPANGMLDDWEENLAIITANRTKDDELVIVHLGDCLWKEKGEITAAHTCYLVAEATLESYSDSARMCLIGADHWKFPRTYASPEAIQRTELYEYSKVLGNSQIILLPFQPYKLVYAYMLAEVGKVSESLRYCQASLKLLKNSCRAPEVEMWKSLLSSLEERIRAFLQGGYSTNLAPAKIVGKLFTSIDSTIHRIMGAQTSPLPPMPQNGVSGKGSYSVASKVANSRSTMAMSSLVPSASIEAISEWTVSSSRKTMPSRSISEPDFSRSSKQDLSKDVSSPDSRGQTSLSGGPSRFGRFGSQLLQKTMGWVSRSHPDRQAKLGERNKFYYDEKLKRWVEEGADPPTEEAALQSPPTTASFHNGQSDCITNSTFRSPTKIANGGSEKKSPSPSEHGSGIPPMSPSPNQFSVRGRMGVRSRYVDTFNKAGGVMTNSFQSPSTSSIKPVLGAKLFVPSIPATSDEQEVDRAGESIEEAATTKGPSTSMAKDASFASPSPLSMQRISSMDNIAPSGNKGALATSCNRNNFVPSHTRAASWGGAYGDTFTSKTTEMKPLEDGRGMPSSFIPNNSSSLHLGASSVQLNGGNLGDNLHEVQL
ncbi:protein transport protein SEC16B homolog [Phoenix dactylifera]|uniref:Protein transport protein sec16 n=1 Tax=Phoenix dactylifera TaxID=42345 RepID=A0A8B7BWS5_PHODC|nr:protein transport protein SEC16B homolog [Phoenix dactylifera]